MNELLSSDEEQNGADIDEYTNSLNGYKSLSDDDEYEENDRSLMDSDEERI